MIQQAWHMVRAYWWNDADNAKLVVERKTCSSVTLSIQNALWTFSILCVVYRRNLDLTR
jgi:hypothetical protein